MAINDASDQEEIIAELQNIAERLDGLILESVRMAVREGQTKRPETDKKLTKCRNQIIRTIRLLTDSGDDL